MDARVKIRTKFLLNQLEKKFSSRTALAVDVVQFGSLANRNILIVAPHPDDEVIGCGGIIQNINKSQNSNIHVLFVTVEDERSVVKPTYVDGANIRYLESKEAKAVLQYQNADYLNIRERTIDCDISAELKLRNKITDMLIEHNITDVFLPNHFDMNPDHRTICEKCLFQISIDMSQKADLYLQAVYLYEIWGPVNPSHVVALTNEQYEKKLRAMECYNTQLGSADYMTIIAKISDLREQQISQNRADIKVAPGTHPTEFFEFINPGDIPDYLTCNF
jgi:LmbE family N-acetylglucosaminyl deacetylase